MSSLNRNPDRPQPGGLSVTKDAIYFVSGHRADQSLPRPVDRELFSVGSQIQLYSSGATRVYTEQGLEVRDNAIYILDGWFRDPLLERYSIDPDNLNRYTKDLSISLPSGLTSGIYLGIPL